MRSQLFEPETMHAPIDSGTGPGSFLIV
jgi:hypothetical protein